MCSCTTPGSFPDLPVCMWLIHFVGCHHFSESVLHLCFCYTFVFISFVLQFWIMWIIFFLNGFSLPWLYHPPSEYIEVIFAKSIWTSSVLFSFAQKLSLLSLCSKSQSRISTISLRLFRVKIKSWVSSIYWWCINRKLHSSFT